MLKAILAGLIGGLVAACVMHGVTRTIHRLLDRRRNPLLRNLPR